ncbi:18737_t:CDS:1 [Dentiscutata erythropus]|uniref:18737_t:CDS:1 n=1 Tax=Dentiscutata erythropus TaxID=1348616 RepID=A0A9N9JK96_9GLOM|nr:18737_t:CDS:1 [Dentiscutata erythropus]
MFIRKLCVLLVLSAIIKISTSYHKYPIHTVNYHVRGYYEDMIDLCIRFLNYNQTIINTICHTRKPQKTNGDEPSTDLSAGYKLCSKQDAFPHQHVLCSDKVFWWDGWTGQKFCNDMHLHISGIGLDVKLSWSYTIVNGDQICTYP